MHRNSADSPVCTVLYTDDQILLAEKEEHLQKGGFSLNKILEIFEREDIGK
jgi:DNA-binding transcriptional MerR regulator